MDNLRFITLPSFDLHIVRHHSVFGLRHIEFGNARLSGQAEIELLTWLDGQTNAVSFRLPFLLDDDDDALPPTALPATSTCIHLLSAPTTPSQPFEARQTLSLSNFHYSSTKITIRHFSSLRHAPDFSQHQAGSRYFPCLRCHRSR
ncbi:hypothetical protein ARMGADRAFT_136122 [Armillaria gallica]|uniref:Uncharacterized protein n=1 Tax=Armillaria gallica TaxID=47427 RepID=A0A2H3CDJ7_ARMGA|nr:hypothetical protein ARMGADRAFT_136122 [Armillaria gallica]